MRIPGKSRLSEESPEIKTSTEIRRKTSLRFQIILEEVSLCRPPVKVSSARLR
jgi:hypothetical protein